MVIEDFRIGIMISQRNRSAKNQNPRLLCPYHRKCPVPCGPGRLFSAGKYHENKQAASKSGPRKAYHGRQGPRKQAGCIKVGAPGGLSRPPGTPKTSKLHQSRGPGRLLAAGKYPENKQTASKSGPREAFLSREVPRKQVDCFKVVVPGGGN